MQIQLNEYKQQLIDSIPVITGLGVDIVEIDSCHVRLRAPLDKNINYEGTAFGGSLNTVAILSCYLLAHHILKSNNIPFKSLVIQNSNINYYKPVTGDFIALAKIEEQRKIDKFITMIRNKNIARIELNSKIYSSHSNLEETKAEFNGRFVASL